jgi:hypothetical protein
MSAVPDIQAVTVVVDGIEWTRGRGVQVSAYGGRFVYRLPAGSHPSLSGGFGNAQVDVAADGVRIEAPQRAGDRLRLRWEAVGLRRLEVELRGDGTELVTTGVLAELGSATLFWGDRMIALDSLENQQRLDPAAWRPLDTGHAALRVLRAWVPEADTILRDRPVLAVEREGIRGTWWVVILGRVR